MSELVVTEFTPVLGTGRAMRTYGVVRALLMNSDVDLLYVQFGATEPAQEYTSLEHLTLHSVQPTRGPRRLARYAAARFTAVPDGFARGISPELVAAASALASEPGRRRIIADGPVVAAALMPLARRREVTYNAHNLEASFRHKMRSSGRLGSQHRLAAFERRVFKRMHETWMVSPREVEGARSLAPGARIRYVPNVVDVSAIRPIATARGSSVLLVADFSYPPNREALDRLLGEILPLLWRSHPRARLLVVGRGLEEPISTDPRVEQLGFVEDLTPVYERASCVAIPLLVGGGSPLKFVEALAYGMPIVASSVAARGTEARAGKHYLRADDPSSFADSISRILNGEVPGLGADARALAEERFSIESLAGQLAP